MDTKLKKVFNQTKKAGTRFMIDLSGGKPIVAVLVN